MAVASVQRSRPLADHVLPMNKDVLVVGGGVAGMNAALSLADQGFKVYLVERSGQLGGVAGKVRRTLEGEDVQAYLHDLIARDRSARAHSGLDQRHRGGPLAACRGCSRPVSRSVPQMFYRQINHGVTILATGALPNRPGEYLLGEHQAVMTQLDLDGLLEDHPEAGQDLEKRGHDPVCRIARPGKPQLLASMLPGGDQECPADPGPESRSAASLFSTATCEPTGFRRITTERLASRGSSLSAMNWMTSRWSRPDGDQVTRNLSPIRFWNGRLYNSGGLPGSEHRHRSPTTRPPKIWA